ncbi:MAG: 5-formyltetrahydrofolate cyclo-ligase [Candidatus Peribacteraceae bacterium]|nr:5-formyltetrahydrofolate cyclo-ligase [Candidatus Peribacteraceae bacterium]
MSIVDEKETLRRSMVQAIAAMTDEEKNRQGTMLCRRLETLLPRAPIAIGAFAPLPDEPDIRPLLRTCLDEKHLLYLPRYDGGGITFHAVENLDELQAGAFGIPEPSASAPSPDPSTLSLVLVPGRAFDGNGNRLGRGKGGYDRWIARQRTANPRTSFWGIIFSCQIRDSVPAETHDQKMDAVITPEKHCLPEWHPNECRASVPDPPPLHTQHMGEYS